MKFAVILIGAVILGAFLLTSPSSPLPISVFPSASPAAVQRNVKTISLSGTTYNVGWIKTTANVVKLVPNFEEKLIAKDALQKNGCQSLVNGGFYTTEGEPTGLFIHEGAMKKEQNTNALLNGVLAVTFDEKPTIGKSYARGSTRIGLQSGPLLMQKGQITSLSLKSDEAARRIAVASLTDNTIVFFVFYMQESAFGGPYLKDMPKLIAQIKDEWDLDIVDAVNLDGGTASAFLSADVSLTEASPIGSYFCIR